MCLLSNMSVITFIEYKQHALNKLIKKKIRLKQYDSLPSNTENTFTVTQKNKTLAQTANGKGEIAQTTG